MHVPAWERIPIDAKPVLPVLTKAARINDSGLRSEPAGKVNKGEDNGKNSLLITSDNDRESRDWSVR